MFAPKYIQQNNTNQPLDDAFLLLTLLLQDAFSLLAYSDPWSSPVGYQLNPVLREPVCASLNSAILGELFRINFIRIISSVCHNT